MYAAVFSSQTKFRGIEPNLGRVFVIAELLGSSVANRGRKAGPAARTADEAVAESRSLPAAELALLSLAEVVLGPVWVWLFLGETVGLNTLIGGGILLAAIAGNALSGIRRKPPAIITP